MNVSMRFPVTGNSAIELMVRAHARAVSELGDRAEVEIGMVEMNLLPLSVLETTNKKDRKEPWYKDRLRATATATVSVLRENSPDPWEQAAHALAQLVRDEYGADLTLAYIAQTWGVGITDEQVSALVALEAAL